MLRLDRALTLYAFDPLLKLAGTGNPVPVLMYHSISDISSSSSHSYFEVRTPPAIFRAQMTLLRDAGFETLFPSEIQSWFASNATAKRKAVCLTFDDAYEDFLMAAFPILLELGCKSTVYVPTGLVGRKGPNGRKVMTWNEIRDLYVKGVKFGSHTVTHPELSALRHESMQHELSQSKEDLEDALGGEVKCFSHPFAFPEHDHRYVSRFREAALQCGYSSVVTTTIGTVARRQDQFLLPRIPINGWDDDALFLAKVRSAYDWMHSVQLVWKCFRSMLQPH